jgi:hypothetical protein
MPMLTSIHLSPPHQEISMDSLFHFFSENYRTRSVGKNEKKGDGLQGYLGALVQ